LKRISGNDRNHAVITEDRRKFWLIFLVLVLLLQVMQLSLPRRGLDAPMAAPMRLDLAGSCQTTRPPSQGCARDGALPCAIEINICG
jgi:hypothetical protein